MDNTTNGVGKPTKGVATAAEILGIPREAKKPQKPAKLTPEEYARRERDAQQIKLERVNATRIKPGFVFGLGATHAPADRKTYVPKIRV